MARADRTGEPTTTGRAAEVLRAPGDPQRATYMELFFDLVFVFTLSQLSQVLIRRLDWRGAYQTMVLLLAVWWVWTATTWITDRLDPRLVPAQLIVIGTIILALPMAAALPEAYGKQGLIFAGTYVGIQIGRNSVLVPTVRGLRRQRTALGALFWSGVSTTPWIAGAFAYGTARAVLWSVGVAIDYAGFALGFPAPRVGRTPPFEAPIGPEHLAERYRQFFIVALGELILVTGLAVSRGGFGPGRTAAYLTSVTTTVLLWRIYLFRAGQTLPQAIAAAPEPVRLGIAASYAHLVMVAGVVTTAAGAELVIAHPLAHNRPAWVGAILGGPALFLLGCTRFDYAVFGRVTWDRPIGLLTLAALTPPMVLVPPLPAALAAAAVLAGVATTDVARRRSHARKATSPPPRT